MPKCVHFYLRLKEILLHSRCSYAWSMGLMRAMCTMHVSLKKPHLKQRFHAVFAHKSACKPVNHLEVVS